MSLSNRFCPRTSLCAGNHRLQHVAHLSAFKVSITVSLENPLKKKESCPCDTQTDEIDARPITL